MKPIYNFAIDVPVRTEWRNVSLLVASVKNCFSAMFADVDGSDTIAMITGELLENAIKYGSWRGDENTFRLHVEGSDGRTRVTVENPVARPEDVAALLATLDWLRTFDSADAAYRAKLLEIAQAPPSATVSRLGLVRIAYEARCSIVAHFSDGVVRVTAELQSES